MTGWRYWRVLFALLLGIYLTLVCQGPVQGTERTPPHLILFETEMGAGTAAGARSPLEVLPTALRITLRLLLPVPIIPLSPHRLAHSLCTLAPLAPIPPPALGTLGVAPGGAGLLADAVPPRGCALLPPLVGKPQTRPVPELLPPRAPIARGGPPSLRAPCLI